MKKICISMLLLLLVISCSPAPVIFELLDDTYSPKKNPVIAIIPSFDNDLDMYISRNIIKEMKKCQDVNVIEFEKLEESLGIHYANIPVDIIAGTNGDAILNSFDPISKKIHADYIYILSNNGTKTIYTGSGKSTYIDITTTGIMVQYPERKIIACTKYNTRKRVNFYRDVYETIDLASDESVKKISQKILITFGYLQDEKK